MSQDDDGLMAGFAALVNAFGGEQGRDAGALMPQSDVDDFANGARWIPGEVTLARRAGQNVNFVREGDKEDWHWEMPDSTTIKHG